MLNEWVCVLFYDKLCMFVKKKLLIMVTSLGQNIYYNLN